MPLPILNQLFQASRTAANALEQVDPESIESERTADILRLARAVNPVSIASDNASSSINFLKGVTTKYVVIGIAVVVVALVLYGFLPAIGKKFAK